MIAIEQKANRGKLLAAIAVLAMVACAFAAILPADDSTALPANFPDAEEGVITVSEDLTLKGNATITDRLVINGTLTVPAGYTLNVNYAFNAAGQSAITFGANGKLVVSAGATVNINVSNATGYTPAADAGNHVFTGATGYENAAIEVNGTMSVSSDAAVKGVTNYGTRMIQVASTGTFTSNANGYQTVYFDVNGGTVDITVKDGRVAAYIDVAEKGTFSVGGTNASAAEGSNFILEAYSANVAAESTLNIEGKATIYDGSNPTAVDGMTIKQIANAGTVNVTADGSLQVPAETTYNTENGTTNVSGSIDISGTYTGKIYGDGQLTTSGDTYPWMDTGFVYVADNGYSYYVDHYLYTNSDGEPVDYQFGLAVNTITYDNTPIWIDELSVMPRALPLAKESTLTFSNNSSSWYDPESNETYTGWLRPAGEHGDAGSYNRVILFECDISAGTNFSGNTLQRFLNLTVLKATVNVDVTIEGWQEGDEPNAPSTTVTIVGNGNELTEGVDYNVTYTYYDSNNRPLAGVPTTYGTYTVKATVTPITDNYVGSEDTATFTITPNQIDSAVEFHPMQDLNDNALVEALLGEGIDLKDLQENINFDAINNAIAENNTVSGKVTGTLKQVLSTSTTWTTLTALFSGQTITGTAFPGSQDGSTYGYFLAFYVEGNVDSIADFTTMTSLVANATMTPEENKIIELDAGEDGNPNQKYYLAFIQGLQADNLSATTDPVPEQDVINYNVDFDGSSVPDVYAAMEYNLDLSFLNMYAIVYNDFVLDENGKEVLMNDDLVYYRVTGAQMTIISGAGENFLYWSTEEGSPYAQYKFGSVFTVSDDFDTDNDGVINFNAVYGTAGTGGDTGETNPATDVVISVHYDQNNRVVVSLTAVGGGYIPAGTLTVSGNYVVSEMDPVLGIPIDTPYLFNQSEEITQGTTYFVFSATDYDFVNGMISISASYTYGDITVESNYMSFEYVAPETGA